MYTNRGVRKVVLGEKSQQVESSEYLLLFPLKTRLWCFSVHVWAEGEHVPAPEILFSLQKTSWDLLGHILNSKFLRGKNLIGPAWIRGAPLVHSTVAREAQSGSTNRAARAASLWVSVFSKKACYCEWEESQVKDKTKYLLKFLNKGRIRCSTSSNINFNVILAISEHVSWIKIQVTKLKINYNVCNRSCKQYTQILAFKPIGKVHYLWYNHLNTTPDHSKGGLGISHHKKVI